MTTKKQTTPKRKSGFYRVRKNGVWQFAEYFNRDNYWNITGSDEMYEDKNFDKINETPINPKP